MTEKPIELSRRKILAGVGAAGVASVGAGLGTSAYFSDTESFEGNSLVAGSLDMKVGWDEHYFDASSGTEYGEYVSGSPPSGTVGYPTCSDNPVFAVDDGAVGDFMAATRLERFPESGLGDADPCEALTDVPRDDLPAPLIELSDVKPGDFGEVTFSFSLCDNPGYVWLNGGLVSESENGVTEPESEVESEDDSTDTASLWPLAALAGVPVVGEGDDESAESAGESQDESGRRSALRKGAAAAGAGVAGIGAMSGVGSASPGKGDGEPSDPDGPNDVNISNGTLEVNVGELGSGTSVQGSDWTFNGTGTLYRETYGFRDGTGSHTNAELEGSLDSAYPSSVSPGTTAESTVTMPVETSGGTDVTLEVDRDVTLDPAEAILRVEYTVRNPGGSGATFDDLRLSQYVDYDIGGISDDVGERFFDAESECEYIFQENSAGLFAGFTAEDLSTNHDLREYPSGETNFESGSPTFNNDDLFPDSGTADVTLTFEWSLGELAPGESTTFENSFVYNENEEDFQQEICEESPGGPPTGGSELPDAVQVCVWYDDCDNVHQDGEEVIASGSLREVLDALSSDDGVPLDGDLSTEFDETGDPPDDPDRECFSAAEEHCLGFEWWVPTEVGNEIQTDSVEFDLGFYAEQCRHNDGSGEDDDDGTTEAPT